ncbi:MAG: ABC transporter permease [Oscillospiraceae bacterium]
MRTVVFSKRNLKELIRDPLSYIFCLGFPIVMLLIMTVVNNSIPPEAGMTIFRIDNLSGGIAVFGLSFVMLFAALLLSQDRTGAFLTRLYASPMKAWEFIGGYYLPIILLSIIQLVIAFAASFIIAAVEDVSMNAARVLLALLSLIPTAVMFIGFGLLFGSVFNSNAAPGLCSIIISAAGMLGGIWMDVESIGGGLRNVCLALPFYHSVRAVRSIMAGSTDNLATDMLIIAAYTLGAVLISIIAFRKNMVKDNK